MYTISGYPIYPGVNSSMGPSTENINKISCTQEDHPHTQFIGTIVIHNYTAKLAVQLFIRLGWISSEWCRTFVAWIKCAPIDQDIIGMVVICTQIDPDILCTWTFWAYYTGLTA